MGRARRPNQRLHEDDRCPHHHPWEQRLLATRSTYRLNCLTNQLHPDPLKPRQPRELLTLLPRTSTYKCNNCHVFCSLTQCALATHKHRWHDWAVLVLVHHCSHACSAHLADPLQLRFRIAGTAGQCAITTTTIAACNSRSPVRAPTSP